METSSFFPTSLILCLLKNWLFFDKYSLLFEINHQSFKNRRTTEKIFYQISKNGQGVPFRDSQLTLLPPNTYWNFIKEKEECICTRCVILIFFNNWYWIFSYVDILVTCEWYPVPINQIYGEKRNICQISGGVLNFTSKDVSFVCLFCTDGKICVDSLLGLNKGLKIPASIALMWNYIFI